MARESGNRFWEIAIIPALAFARARGGDTVTAARSLLQMLESWGQSTDLNFLAHGTGALIILFARLEYAGAVATLNGALSHMVESTAFIAELPATIARIRLTLGDGPFDEATARGAAMTHREIVGYAADHIRQAVAELTARGGEGKAKGP